MYKRRGAQIGWFCCVMLVIVVLFLVILTLFSNISSPTGGSNTAPPDVAPVPYTQLLFASNDAEVTFVRADEQDVYIACTYRSATTVPLIERNGTISDKTLPPCAPLDLNQACAALVKLNATGHVVYSIVFRDFSRDQLASMLTDISFLTGKFLVTGSAEGLSESSIPDALSDTADTFPTLPPLPIAFVLTYSSADGAFVDWFVAWAGDEADSTAQIAARTAVATDDVGFAVAVWGAAYSTVWSFQTRIHRYDVDTVGPGNYRSLVVWTNATNHVANVWWSATESDIGTSSGVFYAPGDYLYVYGSYASNEAQMELRDPWGQSIATIEWPFIIPFVYMIRFNKQTLAYHDHAYVNASSYLPKMGLKSINEVYIAVNTCYDTVIAATAFDTIITYNPAIETQMHLGADWTTCSTYVVEYVDTQPTMWYAISGDVDVHFADVAYADARVALSLTIWENGTLYPSQMTSIVGPTMIDDGYNVSVVVPDSDTVARVIVTYVDGHATFSYAFLSSKNDYFNVDAYEHNVAAVAFDVDGQLHVSTQSVPQTFPEYVESRSGVSRRNFTLV